MSRWFETGASSQLVKSQVLILLQEHHRLQRPTAKIQTEVKENGRRKQTGFTRLPSNLHCGDIKLSARSAATLMEGKQSRGARAPEQCEIDLAFRRRDPTRRAVLGASGRLLRRSHLI